MPTDANQSDPGAENHLTRVENEFLQASAFRRKVAAALECEQDDDVMLNHIATLRADLAAAVHRAETAEAEVSRWLENADHWVERCGTLMAERDAAREAEHYANGVADLAIKHRDLAEAALDAARATILEAADVSKR